MGKSINVIVFMSILSYLYIIAFVMNFLCDPVFCLEQFIFGWSGYGEVAGRKHIRSISMNKSKALALFSQRLPSRVDIPWMDGI